MPKLTIDGSAVSYKGIYVDFEAPQARKFCNLHYLGMYFQVRNCILMLQKHKKFLGGLRPPNPLGPVNLALGQVGTETPPHPQGGSLT